MSNFDIQTYKNYIRMSHGNHLLVEGKFDKLAFAHLLEQAPIKQKLQQKAINIEKVENIGGFSDQYGNRERVEYICQEIAKISTDAIFVGFVDREFRDFRISESGVTDGRGDYKISDTLVWSHGHSIENYFFELQILSEVFCSVTTAPCFPEAAKLFKLIYEDALVIAGALSLASFNNERYLGRIISVIDYSMFTIVKSTLRIDLKKFEVQLAKKGISDQDTVKIIKSLEEATSIMKRTELKITRWFCHGHLGIKVLRQIYARCIIETCSNDLPIIAQGCFLRTGEEVVCSSLASKWANTICDTTCVFPQDIINIFSARLQSLNPKSA